MMGALDGFAYVGEIPVPFRIHATDCTQCLICGAIVVDPDLHLRWHDKTEP